jgi:hypothetical protein
MSKDDNVICATKACIDAECCSFNPKIDNGLENKGDELASQDVDDESGSAGLLPFAIALLLILLVVLIVVYRKRKERQKKTQTENVSRMSMAPDLGKHETPYSTERQKSEGAQENSVNRDIDASLQKRKDSVGFKPLGAVKRDLTGNWVDQNDQPLQVVALLPLGGGADGRAYMPLGAVSGDAAHGYVDADGQLIRMAVSIVEPQFADEASFKAVYTDAPVGAVGLDQLGNYVDLQGLVLPVAQSTGSGGGGGGAAGQAFVPAGSVGRDVHGNWIDADGAVISVLMVGAAAKMAFDSMNPDSPDDAIGVDRYGNYVDIRGNVIPTIMATGGGGGGGGAAGAGAGYSTADQFTPLGAVGRDAHGNFIDAAGKLIPVVFATGSGGGGGGSAGNGAGHHNDDGYFTAPAAPAPTTQSRVGPPSARPSQSAETQFDPVSVSAAPVVSAYRPTQTSYNQEAADAGYVPDTGGGIQAFEGTLATAETASVFQAWSLESDAVKNADMFCSHFGGEYMAISQYQVRHVATGDVLDVRYINADGTRQRDAGVFDGFSGQAAAPTLPERVNRFASN